MPEPITVEVRTTEPRAAHAAKQDYDQDDDEDQTDGHWSPPICVSAGRANAVRCGQAWTSGSSHGWAPERFGASWVPKTPCAVLAPAHADSGQLGHPQRRGGATFRPYAIGRGAQNQRARVGAIRAAPGRQRLDGARLGPLYVFPTDRRDRNGESLGCTVVRLPR